MPDRIDFYNRYRDKVYLSKIDETHYEFRYPNDENEDNFCRYGINEDGSRCFVDPPGGPFIAQGENVFKTFIDGKIYEVKLDVISITINPETKHTILETKPLVLEEIKDETD